MPRLLKKSWLASFLEYADYSEIPRSWLEWVGISVLSSSIKRNVHLWYRKIKFVPNHFVILVGPPGLGKGEAMHFGIEIARAAGTINFIMDWHTPQEMIEEIANGWTNAKFILGSVPSGTIQVDRSVCIYAKELAVVLQQYDNLHTMFCEWWDQSEYEYKTKNKGKYKIDNMCVSILGACTPDYIRSLAKDRLAPITGGFTARTIFVYETEKYQLIKNNFGPPKVTINKLKDDLVNDLIHISTLQGEMTLEPNAENLWEKTYEIHNRKGDFDSDASANFKSRISSHIIKAAFAISISESDNLTITRDQLQRAIDLVETVRDKVDIVFRSVGESPLAVSQAKVLELVLDRGIITRKGILKVLYRHLTDEQLNQILLVLVGTGLITEDSSTNPITYTTPDLKRVIAMKTRGVVII